MGRLILGQRDRAIFTESLIAHGVSLLTSQVPVGPLPFLGSLARSPRVEDRLLWLRVAVDYFLVDATPDAALTAEFEANFAYCLAEADDENRLTVAEKLLSRGHAPPYLLAAIEALGGDAALFVLERAQGLPREKLLADAEESGRATGSPAASTWTTIWYGRSSAAPTPKPGSRCSKTRARR